MLCSVYGDKVLSKWKCQNWLKKFIGGDVTDKQRWGRPVEIYDKEIMEIIDMDRHSTTRGIAEKLNVSHMCIEKRLQQICFLRKK